MDENSSFSAAQGTDFLFEFPIFDILNKSSEKIRKIKESISTVFSERFILLKRDSCCLNEC